jgi:hypothetical protein
MSLVCVYADFNAIEYVEGSSLAEMPLTGYGTLLSLAQQGVRLAEGRRVLLYEPNDIECEVHVHFDIARYDPAGRLGEWIARFDHSTIRSTSLDDFSCTSHPCIVCGSDFRNAASKVRNYTECCVHCGASVMAPLAKPVP